MKRSILISSEQKRLALQRPLMEHGPQCWKWGQHHYACAVKKLEELEKDKDGFENLTYDLQEKMKMKKFDLYDKKEKCYVGFSYSEKDADELIKSFQEWHGDILEKRPVNPVTCLCGEQTDKECYPSSCPLNY